MSNESVIGREHEVLVLDGSAMSDLEEGNVRDPGKVLQCRGLTNESLSGDRGRAESQDSGMEKVYARRAKRQKLNAKKQNRECYGDSDDSDIA